ncbi:uncharacterized protein LOC132569934 isoform X3 [Heteronotia binoei]|uniref:uncharacterized protein LOC132569934 isoform X3 n=1 Tax=Heteronotia binoei TaxID=13085 RepID=UPI002930EBFD|nr:uncharacterized protein LOC132569934 isoform X3 [Heteronotia binoei]
MGTHASNFYRNEDQILTDVTDPSHANWIVIHAETCKMTVPEVQRCWSRFLMLQPDEKGNLPRTCFLQTNTPFGQKLLKQIPVTDDDRITFQTYCNAVSWLSKSSLETKLRGYISEDMFVAWVQTLPQETVQSILNFPIIHPNLTLSKSQISYPGIAVEAEDKQGLNNRQLSQVATEVSAKKRNWKLLARKLGISEQECFQLEHEHLESKDQILKMLQIWHQVCQEAPLPLLQAALRESGNADVCNKVFHLSF